MGGARFGEYGAGRVGGVEGNECGVDRVGGEACGVNRVAGVCIRGAGGEAPPPGQITIEMCDLNL